VGKFDFISFLFSAGYLTMTKNTDFKLPNNEIKNQMQKKILIYYEKLYKVELGEYFLELKDQIQNIINSKNEINRNENIQEFKISFTNLVSKFPKFTITNDNNIKNNEIKDDIIQVNEDLIHNILFYYFSI
jgi:hypothetical protein